MYAGFTNAITTDVPNPTPSFVVTPATGQETTCTALQQIATGSPVCSTDSSCTHLQCSAVGTTLYFGVVPCASPPAVSVVINQGGRTIYNNRFSESDSVPIAFSGITYMTLDVVVRQSPDRDSLTVKVCTS